LLFQVTTPPPHHPPLKLNLNSKKKKKKKEKEKRKKRKRKKRKIKTKICIINQDCVPFEYHENEYIHNVIGVAKIQIYILQKMVDAPGSLFSPK
jgi:hypothetical protein